LGFSILTLFIFCLYIPSSWFNPKNGSSMFFRNVDIQTEDYTAQHFNHEDGGSMSSEALVFYKKTTRHNTFILKMEAARASKPLVYNHKTT
jgi:hypothetical protein